MPKDFPFATRKPQRITITVSWLTQRTLVEASDLEGRSLSNLAAYWLDLRAAQWRESNEVVSTKRGSN